MKIDASKIEGIPKKIKGVHFLNNELDDTRGLDDESRVVLFQTILHGGLECDVYPARYDGEDGWSMSLWHDSRRGYCGFLHHAPVQVLTGSLSDMLDWAKDSYEKMCQQSEGSAAEIK